MHHLLTQSRAHTSHYSTDFDLTTSYSYPFALDYARLATLSMHKRWVLLTAQCPRPSHLALEKYNICTDRVLHLKPSAHLSEKDIVTKAIRNRTASAIIASADIDALSQRALTQLAAQYQCEVFFVSCRQPTTH